MNVPKKDEPKKLDSDCVSCCTKRLKIKYRDIVDNQTNYKYLKFLLNVVKLSRVPKNPSQDTKLPPDTIWDPLAVRIHRSLKTVTQDHLACSRRRKQGSWLPRVK
jgi:hypothetical protein